MLGYTNDLINGPHLAVERFVRLDARGRVNVARLRGPHRGVHEHHRLSHALLPLVQMIQN